MPIMLDDLAQSMAKKTFTPHFFDAKLTGCNKNSGLLQPHRNPGHAKQGLDTPTQALHSRHYHTVSDGITTTFIPVYTVPANAWGLVNTMPIPATADMVKIAEKGDDQLYLSMDAHSLILTESRADDGTTQRNLQVSYQIRAFTVNTKGPELSAPVGDAARAARVQNTFTNFNNVAQPANPGWIASANLASGAMAYVDVTCDVRSVIDGYLSYAKGSGWKTDSKTTLDWLANYSLYESLCRRSEIWQTTIDEHLDWLFENLGSAIADYTSHKQKLIADDIERMIVDQLHAIEDYKIPLDLYRNIYASVVKHFDTELSERLCKENLSLMLSDTLRKLDDDKPNLEKMPHTTAVADPMFSPEQKAAIESYEPLILVQSGAGSGKSSVVGARIRQMIAAGVEPKDITVLSFTNAAADHIKEINGSINSMTIASMIHSIYELNYPEHQLSTLHTLMNSVLIRYGNLDEVAREFRRCLMMLAKQDPNAVVYANNFIEEHFDEVIDMLTELRQTTLELEIIIAYQRIGDFKEPVEVASRHLIIDEVQDNSIFEFVYVLKYVAKHKESLFLVGK